MYLIKMALKNLVRHKNRTMITASIIAIAIFFYLIMDSMIGGMTEFSYQSIIDYESGHMQVVNKVYWEESEKLRLDNLIFPNDAMMQKIKASEHFIASSEELAFQAMLNNGTNELPVIGKGVVSEDFLKVFILDSLSIEGRLCAPGEQTAVIGKKLAEQMNLSIGDYVTLLVRDKNNTFNTIESEICGILNTMNASLNRNVVLIPLVAAQTVLSAEGGATKIIVRLNNKKNAVSDALKLEKTISKDNPEIGVYPWSALKAASIAGAKSAGNTMIVIIILMIAAIAIINTVILAALERMEEIGVMKAMGLQESEIIYSFVVESTGIGIIGGLTGILMGAVGVWIFTHIGIDWTQMMNMDMADFGIPVVGKLYGVWMWASFVKIFLFAVAVSFLSSILPSKWAASKDPVKSIYHK